MFNRADAANHTHDVGFYLTATTRTFDRITGLTYVALPGADYHSGYSIFIGTNN